MGISIPISTNVIRMKVIGEEDHPRSLDVSVNKLRRIKMGKFIAVLAVFAAIIAAVIGWGMNLYKLFHLTDASAIGEIVIRILGIVPVVGAVVGWF